MREIKAGSREAAGPWLAELFEWDLYVTLTYDPKRSGIPAKDPWLGHSPPSASASQSHVEHWLNETQQSMGRVVGAVQGLERQGNGWPHWHGLFAAGGVTSSEFRAMSARWFNQHGYARFERIAYGNTVPIARYIAKYMTKEGSDLFIVGPPRSSGSYPGQSLLLAAYERMSEDTRGVGAVAGVGYG